MATDGNRLSDGMSDMEARQVFFDAFDAEEDMDDPPIENGEPITVDKQHPDYEKLQPLFAWMALDIIKTTFAKTTQYGRLPMWSHLKRMFQSANPALNVARRNEDVACDVVYSDTPAVDSGAKLATIFVGKDTGVVDVYAIKTEQQFINTLEDNVRTRGAMRRLLSDMGRSIISNRVTNFWRNLVIGA